MLLLLLLLMLPLLSAAAVLRVAPLGQKREIIVLVNQFIPTG